MFKVTDRNHNVVAVCRDQQTAAEIASMTAGGEVTDAVSGIEFRAIAYVVCGMFAGEFWTGDRFSTMDDAALYGWPAIVYAVRAAGGRMAVAK